MTIAASVNLLAQDVSGQKKVRVSDVSGDSTVRELVRGLLTRMRRTAAWGAAVFAVGASVFGVYTRFVYGPGVQCGCLGKIPLTVWEHTVLVSAIFALAVLVISAKKTVSPAT